MQVVFRFFSVAGGSTEIEGADDGEKMTEIDKIVLELDEKQLLWWKYWNALHENRQKCFIANCERPKFLPAKQSGQRKCQTKFKLTR